MTQHEVNQIVWRRFGVGYFKISQKGGTLVTATFWNPFTDDAKCVTVRDYEYPGDRDDDELYNLPICEDMRRLHERGEGRLVEGDRVRVVRGRKVPIGSTGVIQSFSSVNDRYGRRVATYVVTEDWTTNQDNVELIDDITPRYIDMNEQDFFTIARSLNG